ncbi:hypothetical protein pb186bvf_004792 [Paramecium bursaria]
MGQCVYKNNNGNQYRNKATENEMKQKFKIVQDAKKLDFKIHKKSNYAELKNNKLIIQNLNQILIWNCKHRKRQSLLAIQMNIRSFCISQDNHFLFCNQDDNQKLYKIKNKTKKIIKIIQFKDPKINLSKIQVTKESKVIIVTFYELHVLNLHNKIEFVCEFDQLGCLVFDYCPINNIVILPIRDNILVCNLYDRSKIIQKYKYCKETYFEMLQISKSGKQFLFGLELGGRLMIYDIDLKRKQLLCVQNIICSLECLNISWIEQDRCIIIDEGSAFILIQLDSNKLYKFYKQQTKQPQQTVWIQYIFHQSLELLIKQWPQINGRKIQTYIVEECQVQKMNNFLFHFMIQIIKTIFGPFKPQMKILKFNKL